MKLFSIGLLLALSISVAFAQSKEQLDRGAIKAMCGCFEVKFNFIETFVYSPDPDYKPSEEKHDQAVEWVELLSDEQGKIVLQHLLLVGYPGNSRIVKHWRQDWVYQNVGFYEFQGDNQWKYVTKSASEVAGQWTQRVYEVDDGPRYTGSSTWAHVDGKSFWENTSNAPLPRREYTKRSDYNLVIRGNRHEITGSGWIHEQDNKKVIRDSAGTDVIIAEEKGLNVYERVDESMCQQARDWWEENHPIWEVVRSEWDSVFGRKSDLTLHPKVEEKKLYEYLFEMDSDFEGEGVRALVRSYVQ